MTHYLFVGEKRSPTAIRMGVTWRDEHVCAKTLHEALRACGLVPERQSYTNLWTDEGALREDWLSYLDALAQAGCQIVGMGRRVQRELARHHIPHRALHHPAARGAIRRTERYQAHVAEILMRS